MSLSNLELAIVQAITKSRGSAFGAGVKSNAPGRRSRDSDGRGSFPALADFELNLDPVLRRTVAILAAKRMLGGSLALDDADRSHVAWVKRVLVALQAIADRFWGELRPDVRLLFTDADDALPLPFQATYLLPGLRIAHPPNLAASAAGASITDADLRWLKRAWGAAQDTAAYRDALEAQRRIRSDRWMYGRLLQVRDHLVATRPQPEDGERMPKYALRSLSHFVEPQKVLTGMEAEAIRALQVYNRLIHAVLVAWLAGLENEPVLPHFDPGDEAVGVEAKDGRLSVRLTVRNSSAPAWVRLCAPFVIDLESPVDGLYLTTGLNLRSTGTFSVLDVSGDRLRDLALSARSDNTN